MCKCQSGATYEECCARYLESENYPDNPVDLARARFTAMSTGRYDFLEESLHPEFREEFSVERVRENMKDIELMRLDVSEPRTIPSKILDHDVFEELLLNIYYSKDGIPGSYSELSYFTRHEGRLYYVDSAVRRQKGYQRTAPKVGRNDPCPCGSGLKYKKCCSR